MAAARVFEFLETDRLQVGEQPRKLPQTQRGRPCQTDAVGQPAQAVRKAAQEGLAGEGTARDRPLLGVPVGAGFGQGEAEVRQPGKGRCQLLHRLPLALEGQVLLPSVGQLERGQVVFRVRPQLQPFGAVPDLAAKIAFLDFGADFFHASMILSAGLPEPCYRA